MPHDQRGSDTKTIAKNKERACAGLKTKFDLDYYQANGKLKDEDNDSSMVTKSTQCAIISVTYTYEELKNRIKAFDLMNACMIPELLDADRRTPKDRWDFMMPRNLLDHYGSIKGEVIKLPCDDCLR